MPSRQNPDDSPFWKATGAALIALGSAALLATGLLLLKSDHPDPLTGADIALTPEQREPLTLPGTELPLPRVVPGEVQPVVLRETAIPEAIEKPGKLGGLADSRSAGAPVAPVDSVEGCGDFTTGARDPRMRAGEKEGLQTPDFSIAFNGLVNPYGLMSTMAMPGETLQVKLFRGKGAFKAAVDGGEVDIDAGGKSWSWTLPSAPGIYCLKLQNTDSGSMMCLHGMVCTPYNGEAEIEGYKIGSYATEPLRGNPRYERPTGMIRVEEKDLDAWVSPHLQLGQFVCKQQGGFPKFMLLESRLLLKLEAVVAKLKAEQIKPDTLYVTSGFRTPHYNKALGNKTLYSRHLYGDAADIFVDVNGDYRLDDLNKDGRVNDRDALYLSTMVDSVSSLLPEHFVGGLGFYGFLESRTAFVHTDTRGYEARWGFRTGVAKPAKGVSMR